MTVEPDPTPSQSDSILDSVKKVLGLDPGLTAFDLDITMHINSVFLTLHQLGVGKPNFTIEDREATWDDFVTPNTNREAVRSYIYMKVRLLFDPPASAYGMQSFEKMCNELEWRLNVLQEEEPVND